ncbi:LacI family DNA-binding transcriptional regulator [Amnibacterium kyonggiense]|uniref:LacI family transcriptional regulator n=1 Tax=Amnibacterium kyonggiense TaxID=595671 RepID=A0A4R7FSG9_9MICO|nr:LacI family DNA-binding transcriptional regulator [Amnibacterium kyonggiense]TDS80812.1 LacI family transcriptional regulator [Amnibacterium kyonggiense]
MAADDRGASRSRRPTMHDVAQAAGVSQSTVSFVLNDRKDIPVAAATRQRVLLAADRLGFRLNRAAQDLRLARSSAIGIVADGIASAPFAGAIPAGLQEAAREADRACMIVEAAPEDEDDARATQMLLDRGITDVVYARPATGPVRAGAVSVPAQVFANCWPEDDRAAAVLLPDERSGGRDAARAVLAAGHRDLLVLAGTDGEWATVERVAGFKDAAKEAGLDPERVPIAFGDYAIRSGYRLAREWVPRMRPTAIVCGNDRMALGALLALGELGLRVPDDVSLVGYDDQADFADELTPRLTTVAIPFREIGVEAGRLLTRGDTAAERRLIPCRLVPRESVAAPTPRA